MHPEFYQSVVDNLPIGIVVLQLKDPLDVGTFCFIYVNRAGEASLGIPIHTLINKSLGETLPSALTTPLPEVYRTILQQEETRDLGDVYYNGDGIEGYFRMQVSALPDRAVLVAFQDVTEQKRLEAERKQAELALEIYNRKLEASNRELEEFAYVASHDLQEPLRKILTFGDRLRSKYHAVLDTVGQDYLTRMQNAAVRMQSLISDLLNLSRVATRNQPFEAVDLNSVVADVLKDLETTIEEQNGRVTVDVLPTLHADPSQMRQLFQNLIGNALKFHEAGAAPQIRITSQWEEYAQDDQPASYAMCAIFVEDHGIGFEEKYLDRIFQPFQRLHGAQLYEGTGMGLAICRRIVERHGGAITAKSQPGQGATFVISLPFVQPVTPESG